MSSGSGWRKVEERQLARASPLPHPWLARPSSSPATSLSTTAGNLALVLQQCYSTPEWAGIPTRVPWVPGTGHWAPRVVLILLVLARTRVPSWHTSLVLKAELGMVYTTNKTVFVIVTFETIARWNPTRAPG
eukprot:3065139-Rhodomonas_salina.2